jgi:hypothetical protein
MRRVNPSFDYKWTWRNAVAWAKYSLPSSFLAVGMALFIPKVSDRLRERFNVTHTQVVQVVTIQEIQRDTYLQVLVSPGSYYSGVYLQVLVVQVVTIPVCTYKY